GHESFSTEFTSGKNLVYGKNAAGKSSIAKAIAFGLTGLLPRYKDYDPRRSKKVNTVVDIEIVAPNKKKYLVRRQIPKGARVRDVSLFIYKAEQLSEAAYTDAEATSFLEQIFGMKKDLFERIIYMKEEDVHEFLANPDGSVLFEIDRLIGLDKAHDIVNKIEHIQSQIYEKERDVNKNIKELDTAIKRSLGVTKSTTDLKKAEKRYDEISTITGELLVLKSLIEKRDGFSEKLAEIKTMAEEQDLKNLEAKLIEKQLAIEKEKATLEKSVSGQKKVYGEARLQATKNEAKKELKTSLVEELSQIGEVQSCPTCGREMDDKLVKSTIKKLKVEISALEKAFLEEITKVESLKEKIDLGIVDVTIFSEKLNKLKDLKGNVGQLLLDFNLNEEQIKAYEKKKYPLTIEGIESKLDELDTESKALDREIGKAVGAKEVQEDYVKDLKVKEEQLKHNKKITELIIRAAQETTNKLRDEYSADVKNIAESIWNKYKGEPWAIEWDKNFVPVAKPLSADYELPAFFMSGSEKFLILLAIRLAIQQSLDQFQMLIIDEPCQHLDATNGRIIRDIITSIDEKKIGQSVIFTYNEDYLEGDWSNIIKLR
ncbi:MAG: AAA family ATPase, partial [Candidatus Heimdallarchaeota archaeon]